MLRAVGKIYSLYNLITHNFYAFKKSLELVDQRVKENQ